MPAPLLALGALSMLPMMGDMFRGVGEGVGGLGKGLGEGIGGIGKGLGTAIGEGGFGGGALGVGGGLLGGMFGIGKEKIIKINNATIEVEKLNELNDIKKEEQPDDFGKIKEPNKLGKETLTSEFSKDQKGVMQESFGSGIEDTIGDPIKNLTSAGEDTTKILEGKGMFGGGFEDVSANTADMTDSLSDISSVLGKEDPFKFEWLDEKGDRFVSGILDGLLKGASMAWGAITDIAKGAWTVITDTVSGLWTGVKDVASGIWGGVKDVASGIWGGVKDVASGIWDGIGEAANNALEIVKEGWAEVKEVASNIFNAFKETAGEVWGEVKEIGSEVWGTFKDAGSAVWDWFTGDDDGESTEKQSGILEKIYECLIDIKSLMGDVDFTFIPKSTLPKDTKAAEDTEENIDKIGVVLQPEHDVIDTADTADFDTEIMTEKLLGKETLLQPEHDTADFDTEIMTEKLLGKETLLQPEHDTILENENITVLPDQEEEHIALIKSIEENSQLRTINDSRNMGLSDAYEKRHQMRGGGGNVQLNKQNPKQVAGSGVGSPSYTKSPPPPRKQKQRQLDELSSYNKYPKWRYRLG